MQAGAGLAGEPGALPATRLAVEDLDPWFVAFGRAVGAALLAYAYLRIVAAPRPAAGQRRRLTIVALGVVVGFPLFTSLALTTQTAAHGAVVVTLLPALAVLACVVLTQRTRAPLRDRGRRRPRSRSQVTPLEGEGCQGEDEGRPHGGPADVRDRRRDHAQEG
ncbi:hypothetical protein Acsp02_63150 [Actinoplanes sp. NBRC 103695]|nr:hypothetical protein Acsp02_63150 [Actinoplanes sp. NBRC 103695]